MPPFIHAFSVLQDLFEDLWIPRFGNQGNHFKKGQRALKQSYYIFYLLSIDLHSLSFKTMLFFPFKMSEIGRICTPGFKS